MSPPVDPVRSDEKLPQSADVVIIGGGIIGCSAAYFLAKKRLSVALVEKGRVAGEQSSRNWGWCRQLARDEAEIPLIKESLRMWGDLGGEVGADLGFRRTGVLYVTQEGWITLTGSPYNNAAGGDFSLNSTAGAGAACKGAGIPSSFGGQSTSSYPSVGAAQPQPTVAGGVSQQQTGTRAMIVRVPEPTASKVIPTQPPAVTGNVQQQQTGTRSTAGY